MLTETLRADLALQAANVLYLTTDEDPRLRPYRLISVHGNTCLTCLVGTVFTYDYRRRARRFTRSLVRGALSWASSSVQLPSEPITKPRRRGNRGDKRRNIRTSPCDVCGATPLTYQRASRLVSRILAILEPESAKRFLSRRQWLDLLAVVHARYFEAVREDFEAFMDAEEAEGEANDCASCRFKQMPSDGGHCYMFEEEPKPCAQYQPTAGTP